MFRKQGHPLREANLFPLLLIPFIVIAMVPAAAQTRPSTLPAPRTVVVPTTQPEQPRVQTTAPAEDARILAQGLDEMGDLRLIAGESILLGLTRPATRISVGNPDVADVNAISPAELLLTGKKPGTTQMVLWDAEGRSQVVDLVVAFDVRGLADQLRRVLPSAKIDVSEANGAILLRGQVSTVLDAERAVKLSEPYGKVLNFLEVAGVKQVLLQVRFAEVSRTVTSQFGTNFLYLDADADNPLFIGNNVGQVAPFGIEDAEVQTWGGIAPTVPSPPESVTLFGTYFWNDGNRAFSAFLSALRQNNLLRILAEPNLVAISGEPASFLAGGEFPIPVPQGGENDTITITFKEFGVKLDFLAQVLGQGRIRMTVEPEVSELDFSTAIRLAGFSVPGLNKRRVTTTVELQNGQSLAIGGLLNDQIAANKDLIPLLGDLPVIGSLFRSVRYQRRETELVVFVTPHLIDPLNPGQIPPLPGEAWDHPSELEMVLTGEMGQPVEPPAFYGPHGFEPADPIQAE